MFGTHQLGHRDSRRVEYGRSAHLEIYMCKNIHFQVGDPKTTTFYATRPLLGRLGSYFIISLAMELLPTYRENFKLYDRKKPNRRTYTFLSILFLPNSSNETSGLIVLLSYHYRAQMPLDLNDLLLVPHFKSY